ncbi:MAG TPA: hypothetical protein VK474_00940 [Chthoniobacterales bacterium]|nr:hypothetical protein [Chthoniobacterales bacterium]
MKKNRSFNFVAACVGLLASAGLAQAATCNVPADYPTIQAAVNDPACSEVNVAPGVYNVNVAVNRSVEINGAQASNNDFATRSANPAAESIVKGAGPGVATPIFTINAGDVTIDGFTIKNALTLFASSGVEIKAGGSDAVITNDIFDGISTADTSGNGTAQAVYLSAGGPDNVNIENNEMKNVHSNRSAKGVLISDNGATDPSQMVQIKGNSIHDIVSDTRGAYAVSVANVPNVSGLKVIQNTISNLNGGGWVHAVGMEGDTPGAMVADNDISNLTSPGPDIAGVLFEVNPSFVTVGVHGNNFNLTAAQFGIAVNPALTGGSVNGTCNWWNSPTGPTAAGNPGGTGTKASPGVTYSPWLTSPAPGGSCYSVPTNANQCKQGGWMTQIRANGTTFKNQGDCIQYVNTGH